MNQNARMGMIIVTAAAPLLTLGLTAFLWFGLGGANQTPVNSPGDLIGVILFLSAASVCSTAPIVFAAWLGAMFFLVRLDNESRRQGKGITPPAGY